MPQRFDEEDEYLISESPEISIGEASGWLEKTRDAFPAFRDRNFRLYFLGQLVSMIGTWLQNVAQGWLVLELTHSAFWVGVAAAVGALPVIVFGLGAGVIVDRLNKRSLLIFTQIASMLLALILGMLALLHVVTLWEICLLTFLLGAVNAIDLPARQAFIAEMIEEREFMTSAVALNSATFNASRIVGPAFAGLAIAAIGSGGTFILNGVSFIAAIISLALIRFDAKIHAHHPRPLRAIKEGLAYSFGHERIRILMIASAVMSAFGFSYTSILPSITETVFHGGAASLGYLYAATGAGSLLAAIIMSAYANRLRPSFFIAQGSMLFALSLAGFGLATDFWLGLVFSFFIGLAFASVFSMMNSVIQHTVEDALRGRVMSIYILMFMGFMPAGSFAFGYGMDHWGSRIVMLTGALAVFAIACVLGIKKHVIDGIDG